MANVRNFGAVGDGQTDDTEAILHAVSQGDGALFFPRGDYRITRPIEVVLDTDGRTSIQGDGGVAKIIMAGEGPAFHILGTHGGTAAPSGFAPNIWARQRMPSVLNIEVEGAHPAADAFRIEGTMQATFEGVAVRGVRHAVHLFKRNRNVLISHCHFYHNTGVGVFIDHCNLHQINIIGNHISYNRLGGIRVEGSEVRNLQVTGNDIEYNNHRQHEGFGVEPTAEIYIDVTAPGASVNEVTIASNTIQATVSPGGANIRIIDSVSDERGIVTSGGRRPGLWTITGNVIGSQQNNVHLTGCYGVNITGNTIYSCEQRNVLAEHCAQLVLGSNSFRRHTDSMGTGVRLVDCGQSVLTGCHFQDESDAGQTSGASLLELVRCKWINVTGCQFVDGVPFGIDLNTCAGVNLTGNTITDDRPARRMRAAIRWAGAGAANLITGNVIRRGLEEAVLVDDAANVSVGENVVE